jgi:hypothetical protein
MERFSLRFGPRQRCPLTASTQHSTGSSIQSNYTEKEVKGIKIKKEIVK